MKNEQERRDDKCLWATFFVVSVDPRFLLENITPPFLLNMMTHTWDIVFYYDASHSLVTLIHSSKVTWNVASNEWVAQKLRENNTRISCTDIPCKSFCTTISPYFSFFIGNLSILETQLEMLWVSPSSLKVDLISWHECSRHANTEFFYFDSLVLFSSWVLVSMYTWSEFYCILLRCLRFMLLCSLPVMLY